MAERRAQRRAETGVDDTLLRLFLKSDLLGPKEAMNIPALAGCVEFIAGTVAMLPVMLYEETDGAVRELPDDPRVGLVNDDTGDLLSGYELKRAMVTDYLLRGAGYAYISRRRNRADGLYYVERERISVNKGADPIRKHAWIFVDGEEYRESEFVKLLRGTRDGVTGIGVVEENAKIISAVYNSLIYEIQLAKTGGNKKGFLKSEKPLIKEQIDALRASWKGMYQDNTESCIVLNNGVDFKESSASAMEMQLNENKRTNGDEICRLFNLPGALFSNPSADIYAAAVKTGVVPVLRAFESALNRDLLLEKEKKSRYFSFDTKELLRGDIEKRFRAYATAVNANIMQIDEVRKLEDLPALGLDFIRLGLQDVLYNPKSKQIYTPNTGKAADVSEGKGWESVENESGIEGGPGGH